ncbi:MAG TPA: PAS domain S-box protein [Flavobacterium sp.]|nr:PAS domain S-box protein [Flavobacterium sp.]
MKNNSNKITLAYVVILIIVAYVAHKLVFRYFPISSIEKLELYNYIKDVVLILISALVFKFLINQNEKHNRNVLKKLKNTNREIIESKERYDIVAKATSDTIWDWKLEEDQMVWNKGIQGVFGYSKEEIGKNSTWWFSKIHPEDTLRMSIKLYSFIEQRTERWQDEYRFMCADGSFKYVLDRGFLIKDKDDKPIRMIGAIQDVTKEKEEEQRLRLLETVITQSKDAIMITGITLDENSIPNILFVNSAFTKITGYDAEDAIGKSPLILFGEKSDVLQLDKIKTSILQYKGFTIETISYRKDGTEFWINFSMMPVTNKAGDHSHWISIQRDVTIEKEKEKEREQLIRELTQNNNDLKQFSYITSHNLRAPLSNLTGLLNLVDDIPIDNPELKEIINGFSTSTHLLNETINDLVKVIIIKDNPSINKEKVLIKEVFENVFNQLSFLIGIHKPILKIELEELSILNSNKSYLESIFLNLLTNSIKYKSPNKQLKITITSKVVDDNIILSFKDNGIGIDMERNKNKIFGLYQRFHNHPDSKGLGLYLVKSQVESMNGSIDVESEVGKGTTFTITFKNN